MVWLRAARRLLLFPALCWLIVQSVMPVHAASTGGAPGPAADPVTVAGVVIDPSSLCLAQVAGSVDSEGGTNGPVTIPPCCKWCRNHAQPVLMPGAAIAIGLAEIGTAGPVRPALARGVSPRASSQDYLTRAPPEFPL